MWLTGETYLVWKLVDLSRSSLTNEPGPLNQQLALRVWALEAVILWGFTQVLEKSLE